MDIELCSQCSLPCFSAINGAVLHYFFSSCSELSATILTHFHRIVVLESEVASANIAHAQETALDDLLSEIEFDSGEAKCYSLLKIIASRIMLSLFR